VGEKEKSNYDIENENGILAILPLQKDSFLEETRFSSNEAFSC